MGKVSLDATERAQPPVERAPEALRPARPHRSPARWSTLAGALERDNARLERVIDSWGGPVPEPLQQYRDSYDRELGRTRATVSLGRDEALRRAAAHDVVLCGDDHTAAPAQRVCLELLRALDARGPSVLVVELFDAAHQRQLDAYLRGDLSLAQLKAQIYDGSGWSGFPFRVYGELLEYAKARGIPVVAANTMGELGERDAAAAAIIARAAERHPGARLLVQFGQMHLAAAHLPAALERAGVRGSTARVLTGDHASYFELMRTGQYSAAAQLGDPATFCVYAVRPRGSRQRYLRYLGVG